MQDVIPGETKESHGFNGNAYKSIVLQNFFKTLTRKKKKTTLKTVPENFQKRKKNERKETRKETKKWSLCTLASGWRSHRRPGDGGRRIEVGVFVPWFLPGHVALGWHVPLLEDSLLSVSFTPLCSSWWFYNHSPLPPGLRALDCRWPRYCTSPSKFPHFCQQSPF